MPKHNLTKSFIESLKPSGKVTDYRDAGGRDSVPGLFVRVYPSGGKHFHLDYRVDGKRRTSRIGGVDEISLHHAREIAKATVAQARSFEHGLADSPRLNAKGALPSIREYIESTYGPYMAPRRKRWRETHARIVHCFEHILSWPVDDPRLPEALQTYQNKALARGLAPSSVNCDLNVLSGVFTHAVKNDLLDKHPMRKIERLKVDNSRVRYLGSMDPDEPRRFWEALERREERIRTERDSANAWRRGRSYMELPDLRKVAYADHLLPICVVAADSGLRQGEIFHLEWRDVDFYANVLRVRAEMAKSGKGRAVPMTKRLRQCLEAWRAQTVPGGLVFKGKNGGPVTNVKTAWKKLMTEAEIEDFRFHDLRHDFASRLAMRGVPLFQISRLLGHSDTRTSEKYSHLSPAIEQAAIDSLDEDLPSRIVAFPTPAPKDGDTKNPT